MIGRPSRIESLVLPIDTFYTDKVVERLITVWVAFRVITFLEVRCQVFIVDFTLQFYEFVRAKQIEFLSDATVSGRTLISNDRFAFLTLLSRNQDYTVCSARTVDSSRRSIFQYRDVFDIRVRQIADIVYLKTVYYIKRCIITSQGTHTTDVDVEARTRRTIGLGNLNTGNLAAQRSRQVTCFITLDIFSTY